MRRLAPFSWTHLFLVTKKLNLKLLSNMALDKAQTSATILAQAKRQPSGPYGNPSYLELKIQFDVDKKFPTAKPLPHSLKAGPKGQLL